LLSLALLLCAAMSASAQAASTVGLGTLDSFSVLGHSTVTNTGPTVLNGDLGLSPGTAVTGFPPGTVNGAIHANDAVAAQGQNDLTTAYNDAAGRSTTALVSSDLAGLTLTSGVYTASSSMGLSGDLTLDGQGDPNAVFIFQAGSTLITASGSRVLLIGGAQACNVFWQVGSSATIGTSTTFVGNIMANQSVALQTNATLDGRALARNAAVTLDSNTVTRAQCNTGSGGGGTTGGGTTGGTTGGGTTGGNTGSGTTSPTSMSGTRPTTRRPRRPTRHPARHVTRRPHRSPARPPRTHRGFTG
jgi:hypothetical protein